MFKVKSISTKIHIPLMLSLVVSILTIYMVSLSGQKDMEKNVYESEAKALTVFTEKSLLVKKTISMTNVLSIAQNPDFIEALKTGDKALALKTGQKLIASYKNSSKFQNTGDKALALKTGQKLIASYKNSSKFQNTSTYT